MRVWRQITHSCATHAAQHVGWLGPTRLVLVFVTMVACAGCTSQSSPALKPLDGPASTKHTGAPSSYTLTSEERALDCNVMRGRMKVALLQLQSEHKMPASTGLSRGMQTTAAGIFGGTTYGTDPRAETARETARLYAYNSHLKSQDCKTFDLQKELAASVPG